MYHSKRLFARFRGFQPCMYGLRCSCCPAPDERRNVLYPKGKKKMYRMIEKIEHALGGSDE